MTTVTIELRYKVTQLDNYTSNMKKIILFILCIFILSTGSTFLPVDVQSNIQSELSSITSTTYSEMNKTGVQDDDTTDGLSDFTETNQDDTPDTANPDTNTDSSEFTESSTERSENTDADGDGLTNDIEAGLETNPLSPDTDRDGLSDHIEYHTYRTDPLDPDTDGDGFSDGHEVTLPDKQIEAYNRLNPLQKNVIYEIDRTSAVPSLYTSDLDQIQQAFLSAPVENPNNETGIIISFIQDESMLRPTEFITYDVYLSEYQSEFTYRDKGVRHVLIGTDIASEQSTTIIGISEVGGDILLIEYDGIDATGNILMHEIGHSLGLSKETFTGIDSREYTTEEYPSTMNYNQYSCEINQDCTNVVEYQYSTGGGGSNDFDDWGYIESVFIANAPSTSQLEYIPSNSINKTTP
jgi:hypothetical protein